MKSPLRICLAADGVSIVKADHEQARTLLAHEGADVPSKHEAAVKAFLAKLNETPSTAQVERTETPTEQPTEAIPRRTHVTSGLRKRG